MKTADSIQFGETATIQKVDFGHPSSKRIMELGFTPGEEIQLLSRAVFQDPLAFSVRGTIIAIRKNEACSIFVS